MNQPSTLSEVAIRKHQLDNYFYKKSENRTSNDVPQSFASILEKLPISCSIGVFSGKSAFKALTTTVLLMVLTVFGAMAQIDLRLGSKVTAPATPAIGDAIKYTVWVVNEGTLPATTVTIKDIFPTAGASILTSSVSTGTFSNGLWTIPSIAVGDSLTLQINATIIAGGVYFNTAEVQSMGASQTDADSTPGNGKLNEDDYTSACFSVPLYWYPGDEYTVSVPTGYKNIQWFKNSTLITPSTTGATVNSDSTLTIKSPGTYSFTTSVADCPATGCCGLQIVQGLYATLGNFVWYDTNHDGVQGVGEAGVSGVKVFLLDNNSNKKDSTTTNGMGKYALNNIIPGDYFIKFDSTTFPVGGYKFTVVNSAVSADKNSDADPTTGKTVKITLIAGQVDTVWDAGIYKPQITCSTITSITATKGNICAGDSTYLKATSSDGTTINWYTSATGTTIFAPTNSNELLKVKPTLTTTYYAALATVGNNCANPRQPIKVVVNLIPTTPVCGCTIETCSSTTVDLTQHFPAAVSTIGGKFEWHTTTNPASSPVVTVVGSGTYYLFELSAAGCYSLPATAVVNITQCAKQIDLSLQKTVSNTTPTVNNNVTYTITVANAGPDQATNVEVRDVLPTGLSLVSLNSGLTISNDTLTGKVASINAGTSVTFTFVAKVTGSQPITNLAEVSKADQQDVDSVPNNAKVHHEDDDDKVIITPQMPTDPTADLSLKKTVSTTSPNKGDQITYYIKVTNDGPNAATNVQVTDHLPAGLLFVSATSGATESAGTITANFAKINVGETATFNITVKVTADGSITNLAQVSKSDQKDPDSTPNNAPGTHEDDDDTATIIVGQPCNVAMPLISCFTPYICKGDSAKITAYGCTGTVIWSNGQSGTSISVAPEITTTYTAICSTGENCKSSKSNQISIIVSTGLPPAITASATSVCGNGQVTIMATGCASGLLTWSTGQTGTNPIVVSPTVTTDYYATCAGSKCNVGKSNTIKITVGTPGNGPTITASNQNICKGTTVTLTAAGCNGTVIWSTTQSGTQISVTPNVTTGYWAQCKIGECTSTKSATVTVTVTGGGIPVITANKDAICGGDTVTLTAAGCLGTLTWTGGATGSIIKVTPTATASYGVTCSTASCTASASKTITVTKKPDAPDTHCGCSRDKICLGDTLTFIAKGCTGLITWSTGQTGVTSITVSPKVTTSYWATCTVNGCTSNKSTPTTVTIITQTPVLTASAESTCSGGSVDLTATGCTGALTWSTGQIGTTITVKNFTKDSTITAFCTVDFCVGKASKTIKITNIGIPVISANKTTICEPGSVTLTATGCTGTVVWSNTQSGSAITPTITVTTTYWATCVKGNCTSPKSNEVTISVGKTEAPKISSERTSLCAGESVVLKATNCSGTIIWSNNVTGSTITVSPAVSTTYSAVCELSQICVSDKSNQIVITIFPIPDAPVITCHKTRICLGDTLTLNAIGCSGIVKWSTGQTTSSISVHPTETTLYTATCKVNNCESPSSVAATVNVGKPLPPVVSCKQVLICGGNSTTLEGEGCIGTVVWSDGQKGAIVSVSPTKLTSYYATCDGGKCQSDKSNVIAVSVVGAGIKKPVTKDLVNLCPNTSVDLTTGVTSSVSTSGGLFVFRTGTTAGSPAVANPSEITTSGTYYVFEKAGSGCFSDGAPINVLITKCGETTPDCINNPATASVGKDTSICVSGNSFQLKGKIGGAASSAKWTSDGTGTFDNALSLTAKYSWTSADIDKGTVKFTLTTNDPDGNGSCLAATASFTLTLNGIKDKPTIQVSKSPILCFGDSVTLTANEQAAHYKWSNGATTQSITVKLPGVYTVQLGNAGGCNSVSSDGVTVSVNSSIAAPTVNSPVKNTCPATTVDLNTAVLSTPKTANGAFIFHTGSSPDSPMIGNVGAMGAGTYYVLEKSTIGCYSPAATITVTIDQCEPSNPGNADVAIKKVGNKTDVHIGDELTYTITVTNNGSATATHVLITDYFPVGLELVSGGEGLAHVGDSLSATINSIPVGSTVTFSYVAKLLKAGLVKNIVKIVKADQTDPVTSNNISEFDVQCSSCQEACIAMALAADTTKQSNGSYNIKFTGVIDNCGNIPLQGVDIEENLGTMFTAPATFTMVQKPTAKVGSHLQTNDSFNGTSDKRITIPEGSTIVVGGRDTVTFVINVVQNGNSGPFSTNALAQGIGIATNFGDAMLEVSDVSTNGMNPIKAKSDPTVVKLFSSPSIALTYKLLDSTKKGDGSYDLTYLAIVKNNGSVPLSNVQVVDTVSHTFKVPITFSIVGVPTVNAGSQLQPNNGFNGNSDAKLIIPAGSQLPIGKIDSVKYTINVVAADSTGPFNSYASAIAQGPVNGSTQTVADSSPTSIVLGNDNSESIQVPCIGTAMTVKDTLRMPDGSYNVTYSLIVRNCGNLNLNYVQIVDSLSKTFTAPATFTIAAKTLNASSSLVLNPTFDGKTDPRIIRGDSTSRIIPTKIDTITFTVNVKLNGQKGPFKTNSVTTAKSPSGQTILDVSNDGVDLSPVGSITTVVNFNPLPGTLIGLAKEASTTKKVKENVYDVTYTLYIKNYGKTDFSKIQVFDDLGVTFGDSVTVDSVNVTADAGFKVNSLYKGQGLLTDLLIDSLSTLPQGTTRKINLFVRVDLSKTPKRTFSNIGLVKGTVSGTNSADDQSTMGTNPDTDGDGNPTNNSIPTKVVFGTDSTAIDTTVINPSTVNALGIAKAVKIDSSDSEGDFLTYVVILKNYGTHDLTNVQISDSLSKVFADSAVFAVSVQPRIFNKTTRLKLNGLFNGYNHINILGDSSVIAKGKSDTLYFQVKVLNTFKDSTVFKNSIYGSAIDSSKTVTDISQSGLNPDKDGNKNPGNDSEPTLVKLKGSKVITPIDTSSVFIPQGFSPNGDGNNDNFIINGLKGKPNVELLIYNRYGLLVYKNEDFGNDKNGGWNGKTVEGVKIEPDTGGGLPDGTYFYYLKAASYNGGKPKIGFITLVR